MEIQNTITGEVGRIRYRDDSSGFSIFTLITDDDEIVIKGNTHELSEDSTYECVGFEDSDKYGTFFKASMILPFIPKSIAGLEKFLGSGIINGIGPVYAKKIVKKFGEDAVTVISQFPGRLEQVPGIGKKRVATISGSWKEYSGISDILRFLKEFDVSNNDAFKIHEVYKAESIAKIKENPYRLTSINRIGFTKADAVAGKLGYTGNHPLRVQAGIQYILEKHAKDGHTCITRDSFVSLVTASNLLNIEVELAESEIAELVARKKISSYSFNGETFYALIKYDKAERLIAKRLHEIKNGAHPFSIKDVGFPKDKKFSKSQALALKQSLKSKLLVVTGGPGVGKTTVMKAIIEMLVKGSSGTLTDKRIMLAAPTGLAAKRMSASTLREAGTIHRLLGCRGANEFNYNENNQLECDLLFLDEVSMLDAMLMASLLKAIPDNCIVIILGDPYQLQSVGAGNVLHDIIESGVIAVVRLVEPWRQGKGSKIIKNAYKIINGIMPDISNGADSDFFFIEKKREDITSTIVGLVSSRLPAKYKVSSQDIQVLSPLHNAIAGNNELNAALQNAINPIQDSGCERKFHGVVFREGDKVMQTKNDSDYDIYNGDVGILHKYTEEGGCKVEFSDSNVTFEDVKALNNMQLSYSCSIHKSQGSEFEIVVIPVTHAHHIMLNRNIFYTGITRAKRIVVMVGESSALRKAVNTVKNTFRETNLKQHLIAA